jgi:hypothetical protein
MMTQLDPVEIIGLLLILAGAIVMFSNKPPRG